MIEIKRITNQETELATGLFDKYRTFYKQEPAIALAQNYLQARLDNNESVIFVALDKTGSKIVPAGFTQLYPAYSSIRVAKNWILNDLFVDPEYRKQGIGEKLIRTAMQFAKENNAKYLQLETAIDNYTAQSLYEQIGFIKQPADTEYYVYKIGIDN